MSEYKCCKCGESGLISIKWKEHETPYDTRFGVSVSDNECLICKCGRCEYTWREQPLDKKEKQMSEKITEVNDIESVSDSGDAGPMIEIECPNCYSKIQFARYGWWETSCECGEWDYNFEAWLTIDGEKE